MFFKSALWISIAIYNTWMIQIRLVYFVQLLCLHVFIVTGIFVVFIT